MTASQYQEMDFFIKTEFGRIVEENRSLPDTEQLSAPQLSLDPPARGWRMQDAETNLCRVRDSVAPRARERRHAAAIVLSSCWDTMHVKARKISILDDSGETSISSFPLGPDQQDAEVELRLELARQEMALSVTKLISFKPWNAMTDSELEQRLNASPLDRRSFKSVAEGVHRVLVELQTSHAQAQAAARGRQDGPEDERDVLGGSITHRLLEPDTSPVLAFLRTRHQAELNVGAHEAAKHAVLLQALIRDLKLLFNGEFDQVWQVAEQEHASKHPSELLASPVNQEAEHLLLKSNMVGVKLTAALRRLRSRELAVEIAIRQEELKVARIRLWCLEWTDALRLEHDLREQLRSCESSLARVAAERAGLQGACDAKLRLHEDLTAHERLQSRVFTREFTHLSPALYDQLSKWYRRRPAVHLPATQWRLLSEMNLGRCIPPLDNNKSKADHDRAPWRKYAAALLEIEDRSSAGAAGVDPSTWSALCRMRRAKIEIEIKVRASGLDVTEAETALAALDSRLAAERRRSRVLTNQLDRACLKKRRLLLDTEVQVLLPRGHVEVHVVSPDTCQSSVMVPLNYLTQLNRLVREAGTRKLTALRAGLRFCAKRVAPVLKQSRQTELEAKMLEDELHYLRQLPIIPEIHSFLKGGIKWSNNVQFYDQQIYERRMAALRGDQYKLQRQIMQMRREISALESELDAAETALKAIRLTQNLEKTIDHTCCKERLLAEQSRVRRRTAHEARQLQLLTHQLELVKRRTFPTLFDVSVE